MLDGLACHRIFLHFIEDNQGLSFIKFDSGYILEVHQKGGCFIEVSIEYGFHCIADMCKIHKYVRPVFIPGEFLDYVALADTSSPFNKEGDITVFFVLPP